LTTEAFGNAVAQWGSSANPYRFAGAWGYRDDGDAGLLYIGARYYEPAVGRWTSADKWLGDLYRPLSLNRYLYCEDDPVNHVDPSGRVAVAAGAVVFVPGAGQVIAAGVIAVGATIVIIWLCDNLLDRLAPEDRARLEPPKTYLGTETPNQPPFKPQPPMPPKPPWWWYLQLLLRLFYNNVRDWINFGQIGGYVGARCQLVS
jgi:RHS repeat-associated protein